MYPRKCVPDLWTNWYDCTCKCTCTCLKVFNLKVIFQFVVSLYVTDLLHRFLVNVYSEGTRGECKELPVLYLSSCIMAILSKNSIGYDWGPVYGNIPATERGQGSQDLVQETWLVEKIQRCKIGGNKFSLVYVRELANIIWICLQWFSSGLGEQSLLPRMSKRAEERGDWTVKIQAVSQVKYV